METTTTTTHTATTTSQPHSGGLGTGRGNTYATANIAVRDEAGRIVASYSRQSAYSGSNTDMRYTDETGLRTLRTTKVEGGVKVGDHHPAPGIYRNQRVAFIAQVEALYGLEVK